MSQFLSEEAQKLMGNVSKQFKQAFVKDKRTEFDAEIFLSLLEQYFTEAATIEWSKMKPLSPKFQQNYNLLPECRDTADCRQIVEHLAVVKLNGGLGTTMGCDDTPKSLIELRTGMTFLDFAIKHVQHFNKQYNSLVPLILMNSFNTEKAISEYLAARNIKVKTFLQSKCPKIYANTSMPVPLQDNAENIEGWYPPGHGNIFKSMHFTGILDELLEQGRDICFISNIDNTGATIDLRIAKLMVESDLEYVMECTEKTEADKKGGTLIEINNYIMHLEMPQVPKNHIDDFCSTNFFKIFNTNNIWVNLRAVKRKLATMKMEIIVNKKVLRSGELVHQLETSVGGAIRNFDKVLSIIVPRSRFLPVKKTQDLLALMSDLYEVTDDYSLRLCCANYAPVPIVELSEHFSRYADFRRHFSEIPKLRQMTSLKVVGDVYFGHDVVLKGRVEIIADKGEQLKVRDGECLENTRLIKISDSEERRVGL